MATTKTSTMTGTELLRKLKGAMATEPSHVNMHPKVVFLRKLLIHNPRATAADLIAAVRKECFKADGVYPDEEQSEYWKMTFRKMVQIQRDGDFIADRLRERVEVPFEDREDTSAAYVAPLNHDPMMPFSDEDLPASPVQRRLPALDDDGEPNIPTPPIPVQPGFGPMVTQSSPPDNMKSAADAKAKADAAKKK